MQFTRFRPQPKVEIPGAVPLIDPSAPPEQQVQQIWRARVRVFDLADEKQLQEYAAVWQQSCDGETMIVDERLEWSTATNNFKAYVRWAEFHYRAPHA